MIGQQFQNKNALEQSLGSEALPELKKNAVNAEISIDARSMQNSLSKFFIKFLVTDQKYKCNKGTREELTYFIS